MPYRNPYTPAAQELKTWQRIRQAIRHKVERAFSVAEALHAVRSPQWQWPRGLYEQKLGAVG